MIKYEYKGIHIAGGGAATHEDVLNKHGAEGWECLAVIWDSGINVFRFYFKREVQDDSRRGGDD